MTNETDHFDYMFVPSWEKHVAVVFSTMATLVSAGFLSGLIWFEHFQSDILKTVQVFFSVKSNSNEISVEKLMAL